MFVHSMNDLMSREKIRICLKRALNSTSSSSLLTTSEPTKNKRKSNNEPDAEKVGPKEVAIAKNKQTNGETSKSHTVWSCHFSPLASPVQQQNIASSSASLLSAEEEDDGNPLPAAFSRIVNESESSDESGAERSEHEEEVVRRSKQIRNRERWELLKYKMLISSCCTPSKNPSKKDSELVHTDEEREEGKEEQWDEEREREFVFSLL